MEAGEAVSHVLESVRRRGRPPKSRRKSEAEAGGGGQGLCANDPIDVEDGVACVDDNSGIVDGAKVERETNAAKDFVRFRDNLGYEVGVLENEGFFVSVDGVGNGKGSLISDGKDDSMDDVKGEGRLEVRGFHRGGINLNVTVEEEDMKVKQSVTCDGNLDMISKGLGGGRFDLNCSIDLNEGLDMENGYGERFNFQGRSAKRRRIDLNLEATIDLDENAGLYWKRGVIDLNLGPDCEALDGDDRSKVQEITLTPIVVSDKGEGNISWEEEKFMEVDVKDGKLEEVHSDGEELSRARISVCISENICQDKDVGSVDPLGCERIDNCPPRAIEAVGDFSSSVQQENEGDGPGNARNNDIPGDSESPYTIGSGRRRKRKSHDRANTSETVLRRSSRRGSLKCYDSNQITATVPYYMASSPAVSALSEEQPEEPILLPPKFPLPPSSQTFNLEGLPVMDIFYVHAFLRSFSLLLFLSPFKLEDFVFALKSEFPNSLIDNIHVSLLMTLRRHLEHLSKEGSPSALTCLRSLNWDLLDQKTWPIFLTEYILLHGSRPQGCFELRSINLLKIDYYKRPESIKIEILRSLCDEVIEMEAIRSELVRRCFLGDSDFEFTRTANTNKKKKKRTRLTDQSDRACKTEGVVDDTCDWNSDECCLCKMEGILICCDGCPAAYHARCVGVVTDLLPEGEWYCPECAIDRDNPGLKPGRYLMGAELLGIDLHGRLYFSCLSYLLVSDSSDAEFRYYHKDDLDKIFEVFKHSESFFTEISRAICSKWGTYSSHGANVDYLENNNHTAAPLGQTTMSYSAASEVVDKAHDHNQLKKVSVFEGSVGADTKALNSGKSLVIEMDGPHVSPEGSFDTTLTSSDMQKNEQGDFDGSKLDVDTSVEQKTFYINYYYFGRIAASVAEELTGESSSNKLKEDHVDSGEENILLQMKVISKKCSKFFWPNFMNMSVQRERCGWCFSCRTPSNVLNCLFEMHMESVPNCNAEIMVAALLSQENKVGHLIDVLCYILFIEDRLLGFLCGPWLSPSYSKTWHQNILKEADLASAKSSLLELEANLRSIVFSEEWFKHEDSSTKFGSACYVINSSGASSKPGSSRKNVRCSDAVSHRTSSGPVMLWWRGGTLSRQLYNWKAAPRSVMSRAARKAGLMKIPGILYPEGSELPRRSRSVAWRASVESSISTEQLALQVRELHLNIKWDSIENAFFLRKYDKELRKSERSFRKAILRRKCVDEGAVKYLLDFGKRKFIPDVVTKQGVLHDEGSKERKKYWVNEIFVPLHLVKSFEEKRLARKNQTSCFVDSENHISKRKDVRKNNSAGRSVDGAVISRNSCKENCFSYLFTKAERQELCQCEHCKKDVSIREAVSCCYCKGFFHKRHVCKSAEGIATDCTYTCHKCQAGRSGKILESAGGDIKPKKSIKRKSTKATSEKVKSSVKSGISSGKSKKVAGKLRIIRLRRGRRLTGKRKTTRKLIVKASTNGRSVPAGFPLRRSARQAMNNPSLRGKIQAKKNMSLKEKVHTESMVQKRIRSERRISSRSRSGLSWKNKRTEAHYSYWVNGLRFCGRLSDERVKQFKEKNVISSGDARVESLKCHLCREGAYPSVTNFIACETCGEWYHGDAFGLDDEKLRKLIGFRCNKCCGKMPPLCAWLIALTSDPPDC